MLELTIPGFGPLALEHLVLDMNGTLTLDGRWIPGVTTRIQALADRVTVHVLTADTYGVAAELVRPFPVALTILQPGDEAAQKVAYVRLLGAERTAAVGNGRNDVLMLHEARLGIAVVEGEGCAVKAAGAADILCRSATDALDLLLHPTRLLATLRA